MSEDGNVLVWEGETRYARPMARAALRDSRLTWGARAIFWFLWDCPRNWRPRISHLVAMAPEGRDAVRARIRELEKIGAMRLEPILDGGLVRGRRWVLVAPERWAVETPLAGGDGVEADAENPHPRRAAPRKAAEVDSGFPDRRENRRSGKPKIGKPKAKVHQTKGLPIFKGPQPPVARARERDGAASGGGEVEDLVEAAAWAARAAGTAPRSPAAFAAAVRRRLCAEGPTAADLDALARWRAAGVAEQRRQALLEASARRVQEAAGGAR